MKLTEWMEANGKRAVDVVRDTGIHKSIISRTLAGKTKPDIKTMAILERYTEDAVTAKDYHE